MPFATDHTELEKLEIPASHNYIALFLTLACNLNCKYCINLHEDFSGGRRRILTRHLGASDWIRAINRLSAGSQIPLTLQGGEPTVYKHFYDVVSGVNDGVKFDLLTNMFFDPDEFARRVPLERFLREAPYAPIRVSYHPGQNKIEELIQKTLRMTELGFRVGLYGVLHPSQRDEVLRQQERALALGIDFRTKEFLGVDGDEVHGHYRYPDSMSGKINKYCECRTTEVLISPSGYVFRCHSDLYEARCPVGHILDPDFRVVDTHRACYVYGHCNPCDVKIKTNRFQEHGHTSVDIVEVRELSAEEDAARRAGDNGVRYLLGDLTEQQFPLPVRR
ncbi:MAG: radical SAM protein [Planctomycetota bacterium]